MGIFQPEDLSLTFELDKWTEEYLSLQLAAVYTSIYLLFDE